MRAALESWSKYITSSPTLSHITFYPFISYLCLSILIWLSNNLLDFFQYFLSTVLSYLSYTSYIQKPCFVFVCKFFAVCLGSRNSSYTPPSHHHHVTPKTYKLTTRHPLNLNQKGSLFFLQNSGNSNDFLSSCFLTYLFG